MISKDYKHLAEADSPMPSESGDQVGAKSGPSRDQVETKSRSCGCAEKDAL
jgi:hypothetical protein